jgi:alkylhydroperoxidase family enzyme
VDINAAGCGELGTSPEKIEALDRYETSPLFDDAERAALALADGASELPHHVPDSLFERLRNHFTDQQIVELAYIVALENFRSRFNRTFRIEAQGLYCPRPASQPTARP